VNSTSFFFYIIPAIFSPRPYCHRSTDAQYQRLIPTLLLLHNHRWTLRTTVMLIDYPWQWSLNEPRRTDEFCYIKRRIPFGSGSHLSGHQIKTLLLRVEIRASQSFHCFCLRSDATFQHTRATCQPPVRLTRDTTCPHTALLCHL